MGYALLAAALLASALPAATFCPDSFEMRVVATFARHPALVFTCGDADRDGRPEFYMNRPETDYGELLVLEHSIGDSFDTTATGITSLAWFLGYADADGKADLLAYDDHVPCLYESHDLLALPETLVWIDSSLLGCISFHDLDLDSAPEILGSMNSQYYFLEAVGDNEYALKFWLNRPGGHMETSRYSLDIDLDGRPEFLYGNGDGQVVFIESVGDDSFACTATCSVQGTDGRVSGAEVANDMDRDGKPEAVAVSIDYSDVGIVAVCESPMPDTYVVVWSEYFTRSVFASCEVAVGDVDGNGTLEFAVTDKRDLRLFRCTGDDQYEEMWRMACSYDPVCLFDINADGKDELFYQSGPEEATILEYAQVGVAERVLRRPEGVQVTPTLVRPGVAVKLEGLESRYSVQVLDAAGRVVAEPEGGVWRTDGVSPGVYFFRFGPSAAGCQPLAVPARKVLVVE